MRRFDTPLSALKAFEDVRSFLGHHTILSGAQLEELAADESFSRQKFSDATVGSMLGRYEVMLHDVHTLLTEKGETNPVVPTVMPLRGEVVCRSARSDMHLKLRIVQSDICIAMYRSQAIRPYNGLQTGLAVLTGYLSGGQGTKQWAGQADPRISAREQLGRFFGEDVADEVIAGYSPHWEAWRLEAKASAVARELEKLNKERKRFQPPFPF